MRIFGTLEKIGAGLAALMLICGAVNCSSVNEEMGGDNAKVNFAEQEIINGQACDENKYPASVALILEATANSIFSGTQYMRTVCCTGTLIAPDVVLSAGHCVDKSTLEQGGFGMVTIDDLQYYISFKADLTNIASGTKGSSAASRAELAALPDDAIAVKQIVVNPGFDINNFSGFQGGLGNMYDTSLLFLDKPVTNVKPAAVITKSEASQLTVGAKVDIAGWGMQQPGGGSPFSPPPAAGTVGKKICAASSIVELGDHEMQIGQTNEGRKCHGDSGGPSYLTVNSTTARKERVIGITSHAYDASDADCKSKGGADTRIDAWFDWIDGEMKTACNNGTRVWCKVSGVIEPDYFENNTGNSNQPTTPNQNNQTGTSTGTASDNNVVINPAPNSNGGENAVDNNAATAGTPVGETVDASGCALAGNSSSINGLGWLLVLAVLGLRNRRRD